MQGKQTKCGGGGGWKTIEMAGSVCVHVCVLGGGTMKCGGGGVGWKTVEMRCWRTKEIEMWKWW